MDIETYRDFCLQQPGVTESFPFDATTLVFKLQGKIFTLASIDPFDSLNVKCEPKKASALREHYPSVLPGYHMDKKHWNTIRINQEVEDQQIFEWIQTSYQLVFQKLPKKTQASLNAQT